MGLFDLFKKKDSAPNTSAESVILAAVAKGTVVPMTSIPDPAFSQGFLGQCCGILPLEGKVFAPMDGRITQLTDAFHAVSIEGDNGVKILIHVGIDTVTMKGDGFDAKAREGDQVKKGQLLLTMDLDKIKIAGLSTMVITAITNTDEFASIDLVAPDEVTPGSDLLKISK